MSITKEFTIETVYSTIHPDKHFCMHCEHIETMQGHSDGMPFLYCEHFGQRIYDFERLRVCYTVFGGE